MNAQNIDHWETIIQPGDSCTYYVPLGPLPENWADVEFNDSDWLKGIGGIGYEDNDDNTIIGPAISVYCRYTFTCSSTGMIESLILDMDFDDGFVAYLNGSEIARYNMGPVGSATSWDQPADAYHEAPLSEGRNPVRFSIDPIHTEGLNAGKNVFAVEVHNYNTTSSDLSSNAYLHAGINNSGTYFSPTPYWFVEPFRFDSTLLPLMVIDTRGQTIPDEPRITAHMGLIHNKPEGYNKPSDAFNAYDGQISIEMRGESSQYFYDKKSYSIETQTDSGTNNNVMLLGLPSENDWVLYGPFGDKSMLRNVISYKIFEEMGHYSPRTRFFELILNGEYMGVYVLTEKIKRDKNRVNIAKLTPYDVSESEISGGYILRIDKTTGMSPAEYWESPVSPPYSNFPRITYQYFDPKYDELIPQQQQYIKDWMTGFDEMLSSFNFDDPADGYRQYTDVLSFIDIMILNEFNKDVDAYRLSNYFYKQKDTDGGRLVSGPPWDYNLTFGNNDYAGDAKDTYNWMYTKTINPYWWKRFMEDSWYRNHLYCRWDQLHAGTLSEEKIHMMIDTSVLYLGDAVDRNYQKWPILGTYVWPNSFIGQTYEEEVDFLKTWITGRLAWIDSQWGGRCVPVTEQYGIIAVEPDVIIYPNPGNFASVKILMKQDHPPSELTIKIVDVNGRTIDRIRSFDYSTGPYQISLPDYSYLSNGLYIIQISGENGFVINRKYLKR